MQIGLSEIYGSYTETKVVKEVMWVRVGPRDAGIENIEGIDYSRSLVSRCQIVLLGSHRQIPMAQSRLGQRRCIGGPLPFLIQRPASYVGRQLVAQKTRFGLGALGPTPDGR